MCQQSVQNVALIFGVKQVMSLAIAGVYQPQYEANYQLDGTAYVQTVSQMVAECPDLSTRR